VWGVYVCGIVMCGVCTCVGFVMRGCVYVCGFCKVWVVCTCVGFVMCRFGCVWVL